MKKNNVLKISNPLKISSKQSTGHFPEICSPSEHSSGHSYVKKYLTPENIPQTLNLWTFPLEKIPQTFPPRVIPPWTIPQMPAARHAPMGCMRYIY